jgi:hypothetical protein
MSELFLEIQLVNGKAASSALSVKSKPKIDYQIAENETAYC